MVNLWNNSIFVYIVSKEPNMFLVSFELEDFIIKKRAWLLKKSNSGSLSFKI